MQYRRILAVGTAAALWTQALSAQSISAGPVGVRDTAHFVPFRIIGNIHYVGSAGLASYLITTPQGHILIDTGLRETGRQVLENIVALGYKPTDVKYLMKHFPLNPNCNPAVSSMVHAAACDAAAAAVMARPKGTFDKLTAWFFEHQQELSPATVRRAAAEIGGIPDFDSQYAKAVEEVKADATTGAALKVGRTPTFFVNGRRIEGGLPVQYFETVLEIELKRAR